MNDLDYRTAFELAPIGLVMSRNRQMVDCNRQLLTMFGAAREQLIGQSFEVLYPTFDEFERTGARIVATAAKELKQRGGGRCLISICTAGGMGVVAILER